MATRKGKHLYLLKFLEMRGTYTLYLSIHNLIDREVVKSRLEFLWYFGFFEFDYFTMSEEIVLVNTCGLCEAIVEEENISFHECVAAFSQVEINKTTRYFYPVCDDGSVIRKSLMEDQQELVVNIPVTRPSAQSQSSANMVDIEEALIVEVESRPALWNYTLPIVQRGRAQIKQIWEDISMEIKVMTPDECQKKWKNLRDYYFRYLADEKRRSGSSAQKKRKWRFLDQLRFLSDVETTGETVSSESCRDSLPGEKSGPKDRNESAAKKKRTDSENLQDTLDKVVRTLEQPLTPVLGEIPQIEEQDEIKSWGNFIQKKVKSIKNRRKQTEIIKLITNIVCDAELESLED